MHKRSHRHAKIYLLDAHPVVRMGLTHLIQNESTYKIVGESGDSVSALKDLSALQADILIMGLHLHAMNDLEFIKSLKSECPTLPVLVLSTYEEALYAQRCLRAGARGFISKREGPAALLEGIQKMLKGQLFVGASMSEILHRHTGRLGEVTESSLDLLSNRELEVFRLVGNGLRTIEIAKALGLSHKTIESYREKIKLKLNLTHASELLQSAIQFNRLE